LKAKKKTGLEISDWELLEDFQKKLATKVKGVGLGNKLTDLLKILELKYKIKDESQKEKIFWELVEDLRREVLGEVLNHPSVSLPRQASGRVGASEKIQKKIIKKEKNKKITERLKDEKNVEE